MKLLRKLRNAWVILLIIFSLLLSSCAQVANTPPDEKDNIEIEDDGNTSGTPEEEKPFDPAELSEYINFGYYSNKNIPGTVRTEKIAWKTKRVVTDINDITITLSFGFTPTRVNYDFNDPEWYQSYLENNTFFKNASIYLVNHSADLKILYRTTDEYFTSAKYVCDVIYTSDYIEYKYNHEEEVKLPAELFPGERGCASVWLVAESNNPRYQGFYERGDGFLAFNIYYKKNDDGKIILLTDADCAGGRILEWYNNKRFTRIGGRTYKMTITYLG